MPDSGDGAADTSLMPGGYEWPHRHYHSCFPHTCFPLLTPCRWAYGRDVAAFLMISRLIIMGFSRTLAARRLALELLGLS